VKLEDVPGGCIPVRCPACGDHLAIPADNLPPANREAEATHRQLCPARRRHPSSRPCR
jgi:hypothetical protein